ncbi:phospholipase D family protein [Membranicola marinus]|uniref:Phospholipase D family protein n=1 Tax=Membranihabitans marinus TaxID=1227546 RepID=A0A953HLW0_9BACT|nr:phospholipase D family protein [Membranihabitans marinus]MBY5958359.1 phospholipase D family protein [Membranihabitans marinus]
MKLITNTDQTHKDLFRKLLKKAYSIDIVTAYSDEASIDFIIKRISKNKNKPKVRFITGGNFAITDPVALTKLQQELPGKHFVALPENQVIFQSNVYLFKTKNNYHLVIGSAPCTEEALETDMEASVNQKKSKKKKLWNQAKHYIEDLIGSSVVHPLTTRFIARYETYYEEISNNQENAASSWGESQLFINNDEHLIARSKAWLKLAQNAEHAIETIDSYRLARKVQNRIASQKLMTEEEASTHLNRLIGSKGEPGLWNANGFQGSKSAITQQFEVFRDLVRFVKENRKEAPGYVFENGQEYARKIKGVGMNMISEILITYEPKRFPKLNNALIQKLISSGSLTLKKSIAKYDGQDYQKYTEIIWNYAELLDMKNMIRVDLFFQDVIDELDQPIENPDPDLKAEKG